MNLKYEPSSEPQAILYERHRLALGKHRYPLYPALAAILEGGPVPGDECGPPRAAPHSVLSSSLLHYSLA